MNNTIYKTLIIISLFVLFMNPSYGQIGIYTETPDASSALDVNSPSASNNKGVLIPQLTTAQKNAIVKPAHSLLVYDSDKNCISQNLGSELAPQWGCLTLFNRSFFYMPSINIPTITLGSSTIDLFAIYKNQFVTPMFASPGAPTAIPQYANAKDLYYYITYYNPLRISISGIDANGVMSYTTIKKANYDDYINIVFVVK